MKKIKVCHIITKLELGGAQRNTVYTVSHLDKTLFTPSLITGTGGILDEEARHLQGVEVVFIPELIREINPFKDLIAAFRLWKTLSAIKPDIVHTHSSKAGILGRWAAFFAGVPVIIHTFHGYGFHDFQRLPVKAAYIASEIITGFISDKLIAVSIENIYKGLRCRIGSKDKYMLIRSGIDTEKYKSHITDKTKVRKELGIKEDEKVVTTIGPFKPQKNLKDFITVAGVVRETGKKAVFLIAGDGELRPALENQIERTGLKENVKLLGWRKDIIDILNITDVFVMTSLWEGLPRAILEAMCCGLPVIANSIDGVKEVVTDGETGYLVTPGDTVKMAELLLKLLQDANLMRSFGTRAKLQIDQQFDINYMVKQQEELYSSVSQV